MGTKLSENTSLPDLVASAEEHLWGNFRMIKSLTIAWQSENPGEPLPKPASEAWRTTFIKKIFSDTKVSKGKYHFLFTSNDGWTLLEHASHFPYFRGNTKALTVTLLAEMVKPFNQSNSKVALHGSVSKPSSATVPCPIDIIRSLVLGRRCASRPATAHLHRIRFGLPREPRYSNQRPFRL